MLSGWNDALRGPFSVEEEEKEEEVEEEEEGEEEGIIPRPVSQEESLPINQAETKQITSHLSLKMPMLSCPRQAGGQTLEKHIWLWSKRCGHGGSLK